MFGTDIALFFRLFYDVYIVVINDVIVKFSMAYLTR